MPLAFEQAKSTSDIVRSLLVFKACQFRPLVANADFLLRLSKRLLGNTLTSAVLRPTFYKQFVAGEAAGGADPRCGLWLLGLRSQCLTRPAQIGLPITHI